MRRNNSGSGMGRSQLSNRAVPAPTRKVEGFDLRGTLSPPSRTQPALNPNYRSTIESIKTRTRTKDIQDEYIRGLQDQIKFLEYELKLLKDKELQQQSTVDQLGKFFDDGVPLNENILAMKNRFTSQKQEFEGRCKSLRAECKQKQELIGSVKTEIERLKDVYRTTETEKQQREEVLVGQVSDLSRKLKQYLHQGRMAQDEQRQLEVKHKKLEDELAKLKLTGEMEGVLSKEDVRNGQISLIKVQLQEKDREIGRLEAQRQDLRIKAEQNTVIAQLEYENTELKKKILSTTKEVNLLSTKVDEARFECDNRLKEREQEAAQRRELQSKVQMLKKRIDQENRLTEEDMQSRIAERQKQEIRAIERKKQSLIKYINFKKSETERLDAETQDILSGKAQLQQKLGDLTSEVERLTTKLHQQRQKEIELVSEIQAMEASQRILDSLREPLPAQNTKLTERIDTLQKDTQRLRKDNALKQRQLQLIRELKSFNLDELKLIRSTSSTVQQNIAGFLKKWESIRPREE